jgi:uncharacterized protein YbaR (Trm112 family)
MVYTQTAQNTQETIPMAISQELLEILVCPQCKGGIYLNNRGDALICDSCRLEFEIRDDIPVMLIEEARLIGD